MLNKLSLILLFLTILSSCGYKNKQVIIIKGDDLGNFIFPEFSANFDKGIINFKTNGAQPGILSLVDNASDAVFSLKELSNEDYALLNLKKIYVKVIPIITTKIVFIVNSANPIDSLRLDEIKSIFNGYYKYWWQLGDGKYKRSVRNNPLLSQIEYCSLDKRNGEYYSVKNALEIFDFYMDVKFFPNSQSLKRYVVNSFSSIGYIPISFFSEEFEEGRFKIVNQDIELTGYLIVKESLYKTDFFFNFFNSLKSYLLENKITLFKKGIKVIIQDYN